jgi:hypothetical protein
VIQRRTSSLISTDNLSDLLMGCEPTLYTQHSLPGLDQLDAYLAIGGQGSPVVSGFGLSPGAAPAAGAEAGAHAAAAAATCGAQPMEAATAAADAAAAPQSAAAVIAAGAAALTGPSATPAGPPPAAAAAAVPEGIARQDSHCGIAKRPAAATADELQASPKRIKSAAAAAAITGLTSISTQAAAAQPVTPSPVEVATIGPQIAAAAAAEVGQAADRVTNEGLAWLQLMNE